MSTTQLSASTGAANEATSAEAVARPRLGRRLRIAVAAVLVLLIAVGAAVLALSYPRVHAYQTETQNRADVVRVAERFTTEVNNYDVSSIDGYQKRISPLLTTKFRADFKHAMGDIVTSVQKAKMTSQGQVLASAVSGIDQDSATVLVVADAKVKTVFDTRARHFRWKISLVKVNDRWLVDDFQPIS
ncbi:MAG TPA: hypothetical protein VFT75_12675 [Nocardioidaceae bacterium]|jgi:hypothetical protein|nr:hypothetical protein [Nocardioidaceae bacterium]